ncbi:MAG: thiol:disulfide interchange protein DsbA/DsbL [Gammaproteobacteria bacterium]|nr:thiol:disulfide interchange protein DsbA/DsbL [Gammaproteobacteria bacterium]
MKRLLCVMAALFFSASLFAVELKEGVHYEVFDKTSPSTGKPEIKEFFSYYCPHCLSFEPLAERLEAGQKKGNYKFVKSHVDFLRAAGPEIQFMLTKALVTAETLNVPAASKAIFNYIHRQRAAITKEKDIRNLFVLNGVDGEKFDKVFNSFAVTAGAKKMKKDQDELSKKRVLTGVPTFIVNNKYKILNSGFEAKTYDELFNKLEAAAVKLSQRK